MTTTNTNCMWVITSLVNLNKKGEEIQDSVFFFPPRRKIYLHAQGQAGSEAGKASATWNPKRQDCRCWPPSLHDLERECFLQSEVPPVPGLALAQPRLLEFGALGTSLMAPGPNSVCSHPSSYLLLLNLVLSMNSLCRETRTFILL